MGAPSPQGFPALLEAAKALSASLDRDRVLVRICEQAAAVLAADTAVVQVVDERGELRIEAGYGVDPGAAAEQGVIATPLRWDGALRGVLSLGWSEPPTLGAGELETLAVFADLAAAACRNASAHQSLSLIARTDALTGCLNKAAFQDALARELERCRRTGESLSLVMVDLDHFKEVNESLGHQAGDELLRGVGLALREAVRPYDVVGRYGGDEFAIVAIDAGEDEAREVATRAIERAETEATAGVAEWGPGESAGDLIKRADLALLHGKHGGGRGAALSASQAALSESR